MPIINGQKMACAPCIRGHRSTKCNHFYERVMVPVRKPGRPLSTCPCPPGRPCACGGVRVAIPKKQKCGCGAEAVGEPEERNKGHSPAETPTSPSRPSFRVSKSNGSRASSRKQSFDPANLERMDPRSINLITAPTSSGIANGMAMAGGADFQGPHTEFAAFSPGLGAIPAGSGGTYGPLQNPSYRPPLPYNLGFQYSPPNQLPHGLKMEDGGLFSASNGSFGAAMPSPPFINGNHTSTAIGNQQQPTVPNQATLRQANGAAQGASCCCGSKAQEGPSVPAPNKVSVSTQGYGQSYLPQLSGESNGNGSSNGNGGGGSSCCSSKAQEPLPNTSNNLPTSQQEFGQTFLPPFQFPTVFTYPGDYGSWQHPIDPVIWQQVASQTGMPPNPAMAPAANGDTAGNAGTSHECGCGEGCQCVGCLAHPFNAQMFQYVNNAYSDSNGSSPRSVDANGAGQQQAPSAAGAAGGQDSPVEAPTPAASEGSPRGEEQSLSTMDYFFVNLPISGLCGGRVGGYLLASARAGACLSMMME
ncbi:7b40ac5f-ad0e-4454-9d42-83a34c11d28c [Thermothielavioides terrestris]|uniref:7b40ac5f-ad0e-4454-9d42-83a34c11d28c n=1 Tax=Thermothielavioides terrestris TaxID=2587410 RepID=A0A3S4DA39_9PEZI|nr:7b40ac5f-ad0e-4454-9d42-83a34c11d28c [Thermothielavioides terrestris]